jgi:glucose 1-dehydrogenase
MRRLEGKNVLVTGGSSGIGRATAIRFAQEGANVAINYHSSEEEAEITEAEVEEACAIIRGYGCKERIIRADVSRENEVIRMFGEIVSEWGRLDILINNAGIQKENKSHEVPVQEFDRILGVNLRGAFLCAREAVRHFLSRGGGGVILNDSSVHERIPKPMYLAYAVSKAGMGNLTKTLALEYADRGIRVNAVGPGAIATPINRAWIDDPEKRALVESHIPVGRAGEPEEIAAVFAFLASDDASYITGQTIFACGGLMLYPEFRERVSSG